MTERPIHLVGPHEIRIRLGGISRQRVLQLTSHPNFPKPAARLGRGNVWLAGDVEEWIKVHRPADAHDTET